MNKPFIAGLAVIVLGFGAWWYLGREPAAPAVEAPVEEMPLATVPEVRNPVPEVPTEPLPALADSDQPLLDALAGVAGSQAVQQYLIPRNLVRGIVVTIDNLPRQKMALQTRPVVPTPGELATTGEGAALALAPANAARYAPFVRLLESTDARAVAGIYLRFYPLFQEAYEGLGYPAQYFNDRLVEVIDHLLATPDLSGPIELTRPSVMYTYADPALEALSVGQKTLIRMGNAHAAVVKRKLREVREVVTAAAPARQPG